MSQQHLVIVGGVGIGPAMIGMSIADVRGTMGEPTKQFRKAPNSKTLTDAYDQLGMHVYYDIADCVEFVEAFAVKGVEHLLDGYAVFETPAAAIMAFVSKKGAVRSEEGGTSLVAPTLGLAFWRADEEATTFDSVAVASPGYFA